MTTAVFGGGAALAAVALILWFVLLLLDETSIIAIPALVKDQVIPVGVAGLAVLAGCSVPLAVVYSAWTAAGRRDLFDAEPTGFDLYRPSDRQMRWFLKDAHPWEPAVRLIQVWAVLGIVAGGAAAPTIFFARRPDEQPLGLVMLALAVVGAVVTVVCIRVIRGLMARGAEDQRERERRWPLAQDSLLRTLLRRDTGGNGDIGMVQ